MSKLASKWDLFNALVVPPNASETQRAEMRRSFYAGCESVLAIMFDIGGDDISEAQGVEIIEGMRRECGQFGADVKAGKA